MAKHYPQQEKVRLLKQIEELVQEKVVRSWVLINQQLLDEEKN